MRTMLGHDVAKVWAAGTQDRGRNHSRGNVYFEGDTIYSYGTHFPMAVRLPKLFILNADTYSTSTSRHQDMVRGAVRGSPQILVPLSALRRMGIELRTIRLVEVGPDREIKRTCKRVHESRWERRQPGYQKPEAVAHEHESHLLGQSVFESAGRFYLSGTDETARDAWRAYFLVELPPGRGEPRSVANALNLLEPAAVAGARANGRVVLRQGEWYFVAAPSPNTPIQAELKDALLPNPDGSRGHHKVTRLAFDPYGGMYAKGTVRHTGRDHKMLVLKGWHAVYRNTAVRAASAGGRVD